MIDYIPVFAAIEISAAEGASYECSAGAGKYDEIPITAYQTRIRVAGTLRLKTTAPHPVWFPAAGVVFRRAEGSSATGFQIYVSPYNPKKLLFGARRFGSDTPRIFGSAKLGDEVNFVVTLDEQQTLAISVGRKKTRVTQVGVGPTMPSLMCSSGEFTLTNVQVTGS